MRSFVTSVYVSFTLTEKNRVWAYNPKVARSVPKSLSVNMGLGIRQRKTTPLVSPGTLQDAGVAQVTYPRLLSAAALKGMTNAMEVFMADVVQNNRVVDRPDLSASFDEINDLMGMAFLDELERRYAAR